MKVRKDVFLMYLALCTLMIIFATFFKFGPVKKLSKLTPSPTPTTNPNQTQSSYQCPANGWINCMPQIIGPGQKDTRDYSCTQEAIAWYDANCPNFEGASY